MLRASRRYILITATILLIAVIPITKHFWGQYSLYTDLSNVIDRVPTPLSPREISPVSSHETTPVRSHEITIVTMYVNIGGFPKHNGASYFTPATYKNWMITWGWLSNRVVAFFDNETDLETFKKIRSVHPANRTDLIKLERKDIPAFKNLEKIRTIYQNKSYPKQIPHTIVPEYSCAMNAKYDVLQMAIQRGLIHTEYVAWLDMGLFRNLLEPKLRPKDDRFTLEVPENFNSSTVGMSMVTPREKLSKISPWEYIKKDEVWVSGAFALATKEVMLKFAQSYTLTVNELVDKGMSSTDQTVIGAMYSPEYIKRQQVDVMEYKCVNGQFGLYRTDIIYFCLGHICKEAAEKRLNEKKNQQVMNVKQTQ